VDKQFWADVLRNAKGLPEAALAMGSGLVGEIPAGGRGIVELLRTRDPGMAAEEIERAREQYQYVPRGEGAQEVLGGIGRGVEWAGEKLAQAPGAETVQQGWSDFSVASPLAAATLVGVANVADPSKGTGRAARAAERTAGLARRLRMLEPDVADKATLAAQAAEDAARVKATKPGGDLSFAAERYPELGEPIIAYDKNKDSYYIGKAPSEESLLLMKERARVQREMEKEGYEPFFDPEQRYDANVANYPTTENTLTDTLPAKPETAAKWREKYQTPEAREALQEALRLGEQVGGGDRWYLMGQLEDAYINELGPVEGPARFKTDFADAMAATTGGAAPEGNFLAAMYGNFERGAGREAATRGYEIPSPVGGRYISGNMEMYNKALLGDQPLTAAGQPKRFNFSRNFLGDEGPSTMDERMSQLMIGQNSPGAAYYALEEMVGEVGGRNAQDVAWLGKKVMDEMKKGKAIEDIAPGQPMIDVVNESIERTSRLTGLEPAEVVRRMIRREIPMYGVAGAAVVEALRNENSQNNQENET
jgi:hypothetical protein